MAGADGVETALSMLASPSKATPAIRAPPCMTGLPLMPVRSRYGVITAKPSLPR